MGCFYCDEHHEGREAIKMCIRDRRRISITMSDRRPPNSENRNADTLPISSEEMATRVTTMANASLALSRVSANNVTTVASPNLTPGTGTIASSGNMRSTSESTTATAASMPQSVNRFAFFMCCTPYDLSLIPI